MLVSDAPAVPPVSQSSPWGFTLAEYESRLLAAAANGGGKENTRPGTWDTANSRTNPVQDRRERELGDRSGSGKNTSKLGNRIAQQSQPYQRARPQPEAPSSSTGLPIDAYREEILHRVGRDRVTIIHGETGCGKSSRLPAILYEDSVVQNKVSTVRCDSGTRVGQVTKTERF